VVVLGEFSGGILEALPTPLGSLIELLVPPTLPGPAGTPLTPVVPAPADPALGVDGVDGVVDVAAPLAPCAKEVTGVIKATMTAAAMIFDIRHSPVGMPDNKSVWYLFPRDGRPTPDLASC
jgi:hypothetical protein